MRNYYTLLVISALFTSCKTFTPFSAALKMRNNWTEAELKKIQFYNSKEIVIANQFIDTKSEIKKGKVFIKTDIKSDSTNTIVIKKHTKGVLVKAESNKLIVSFEKDDNHFVVFSLNENNAQNIGDSLYYMLNNNGQINYNGIKQYISSDTNEVLLLVEYYSKNTKKVKKQFVKGKKIKV